MTTQRRPRVAAVLPPHEAYFWTPEWQAAKREALEELERGEGPTFRDAVSALRYLADDVLPGDRS